MSIRKRLVLLLSCFGLYAVFVAAAAIFGSNLRVEQASYEFQWIAGQTTRIDELELHLTEQEFLLGQLVQGQASALKPYSAARRKWTETLQQCAAFAPKLSSTEPWKGLSAVADRFEQGSNALLELVEQERTDEAREMLQGRIVGEIAPKVRQYFVSLQTELTNARNASARTLASSSSQAVIGVCANFS